MSFPTGWMHFVALCGALLATTGVAARAQSTSPSANQKANTASTDHIAKHAVRPHHRHHPKQKTAAVETPAPPPAPIPPAQQAARPATVTFRDDTLRIDADNSSLLQILHQVSQATGIKVDGMGTDERIYGQYGPGPVSRTLSKLLDGAGYNYVIVGGGPGKPATKLLLTASSSVGAEPSPVAPSAQPAESTPSTPLPAPSFSEPTRPKTPQEIFNELRRMHPQ